MKCHRHAYEEADGFHVVDVLSTANNPENQGRMVHLKSST